MEKKKMKITHKILCVNCKKNIPVGNYRIHNWLCNKTQQVHPTLQNLFKSQLKMSKNLHDLLREEEEGKQRFPCPHCSFSMSFQDFDTHPINCPSLPIQCIYCAIDFPKDLMEEHGNYCQKKDTNPLGQLFLKTLKSSKDLDEPTTDEHMDFLVRQIANMLGIKSQKGLTNQQLLELDLQQFKRAQGDDEQYSCAICCIDFQNKQRLVKLPCKHMFHRRCSCAWFAKANTCPICRYVIDKKDLHKIKNK